MRMWWDKWYSNRRWQRRRAFQLQKEPWCKICMDHGVATPATIADHIVSHNGDYTAFWTGALQSLCKPHHDGSKHEQQIKGFYTDIGIDGWPLDKEHPSNKRDALRKGFRKKQYPTNKQRATSNTSDPNKDLEVTPDEFE